MGDYFYDGHEQISGVSGANPTVIPKNYAAVAVNRSFRFDENRTRPGFVSLELVFPDDDRHGNDRKLFEAGNGQGGTFYNAYPSFKPSLLVFSIAGSIFTVEVRGQIGYVRRLISGNYPTFLHAWFAQAFEWLVIQDGGSKPILWNGTDAPRRAASDEVPIGSAMAFIHGRLAVASSDGTNQIAVGDIVYGSDTTNTNDVIRFTEIQYWAEGGAFGVPLFIGDIMFMVAMPFLDTGNGQNELVVIGKDGGISLDLSGPRETWKDARIERVAQLGGGGVSSHGYALLNADLLYRSTEGVQSYRNARSEFQQTWQMSPISTDVRRWMGSNAGRYGQFCTMAAWNNQVLVSVSPLIAKPNNLAAGFHRFHRGFVVLDAQPQSNTLREGASIWQGLQTGIRPVCFVDGRIQDRHRCFCLSYDRDGKNRIYEMTTDQRDDWFEGDRRKIVSFYDTGLIGTAQRSTNFDLKTLVGGQIQLSGLNESVDMSISYRPESTPCFLPLYDQTVGCDCPAQPSGCFTSALPQRDRRYLPAAKPDCAPGSTQPGNQLFSMQGRVRLTGSATVDRLAFKFNPRAQDESVRCEPSTCQPASCCPYADEFTYQLAPEGSNPNIPTVAPPDGIPQTFTATASAIATCPGGSPTATGEATVTSTISFEDALARAQEEARQIAEANLHCGSVCNCINDGFAPVFHSDTYDMAVFFLPNSFPSNENEAWRITDTDGVIYAEGTVSGGSLITLSFKSTGDITWNPAGDEIVNASVADDIYAGLQIACQGSFCEMPDPCICLPEEIFVNVILSGNNHLADIYAGISVSFAGRPYRIRDYTHNINVEIGTIDGGGFPVFSSRLVFGEFDVYMTGGNFINNDSADTITVRTQIGCVCGEETIWPA